jgi:serine/threonine protein kinase
MTCYGKGGLQYILSSSPIATGGEGEIYNITGQPNLVAKIYKNGKASGEKEQKLVRMINFPPDSSVLSQIAWPQDVLYNAGQFIGFIMPKMKINEDLNVIYEYGSSAKYPDMTWENKIIIAQNICTVLHSIHDCGHVCGDLNPKNISVDPQTGFIVFLDTDSYHIQDGTKIYRCDVGIPQYLPVEIQKKMRVGYILATATLPTFSQDTDNFALAIHIFQLLMNGTHPFACAILPSHSSVTAPQPSDNIEKGEFPFMQNISGIRIPVYAPKITILPKKMQNLFKRAFIDGHTYPNVRPKPEEWHTALKELRQNLIDCKKVAHHKYNGSLSSCPWCEVTESYNKAFNKKVSLTQIPIKPSVFMPTKPKVTASVSLSKIKNWWQFFSMSMPAKVAVLTVLFGVIMIIYIMFKPPEPPPPTSEPSPVDTVSEPPPISYPVTIRAREFANQQLTNVPIPTSVTIIELGAYQNNKLTNIAIPNNVTTIGNQAFADNQLTSITIGIGVTNIGNQAFANNKLTSVIIPNNVTTIGSQAFADNQLTSITIGNNVTVRDNAFSEEFISSYKEQGLKAGTYILLVDKWRLQSSITTQVPHGDW